jgi:predicted phage terminase large subunit-like protein
MAIQAAVPLIYSPIKRALPMFDGAELAELDAAVCRADLLTFAIRALEPLGLAPAAHHRRLIADLQWVSATPGARLMVFMPPGSAKSTYASVIFPAWMLARGRYNVIGSSHTAELAQAFSGRVQAMVADNHGLLGITLASEAKQRWRTTGSGEYLAAGVGGAVTGFRADLVLVDDPVKSQQDADSPVYRDGCWQWFGSDITTRLRPGARIVVIQTRWHEDDLAGRILAAQGDAWRVLRLPAFAEDGDPLGRAIGAPLWSDDGYDFAADLATKRAAFMASGMKRQWAALYQQAPRADDGNLFRVEQIGVLDAMLPVKRSVRRWDLAATEAGGDWTCGVLVSELTDGRFAISDVVRFQGGPEAVEASIVATASRDGRGVRVALPQDPGQAGKAQVLYLTRKLAGYVVESAPETGDKATRAAPVAAQTNVGNVLMLRAAWNVAMIEELRSFPSGLHDDQVDALAGGFNVLTAAPKPARSVALNHMRR